MIYNIWLVINTKESIIGLYRKIGLKFFQKSTLKFKVEIQPLNVTMMQVTLIIQHIT